METKMFKIYARSDERIQLKDFSGPFCNTAVPYHSLSGHDYDEIPMCRSQKNCTSPVGKL